MSHRLQPMKLHQHAIITQSPWLRYSSLWVESVPCLLAHVHHHSIIQAVLTAQNVFCAHSSPAVLMLLYMVSCKNFYFLITCHYFKLLTLLSWLSNLCSVVNATNLLFKVLIHSRGFSQKISVMQPPWFLLFFPCFADCVFCHVHCATGLVQWGRFPLLYLSVVYLPFNSFLVISMSFLRFF